MAPFPLTSVHQISLCTAKKLDELLVHRYVEEGSAIATAADAQGLVRHRIPWKLTIGEVVHLTFELLCPRMFAAEAGHVHNQDGTGIERARVLVIVGKLSVGFIVMSSSISNVGLSSSGGGGGGAERQPRHCDVTTMVEPRRHQTVHAVALSALLLRTVLQI